MFQNLLCKSVIASISVLLETINGCYILVFIFYHRWWIRSELWSLVGSYMGRDGPWVRVRKLLSIMSSIFYWDILFKIWLIMFPSIWCDEAVFNLTQEHRMCGPILIQLLLWWSVRLQHVSTTVWDSLRKSIHALNMSWSFQAHYSLLLLSFHWPSSPLQKSTPLVSCHCYFNQLIN